MNTVSNFSQLVDVKTEIAMIVSTLQTLEKKTLKLDVKKRIIKIKITGLLIKKADLVKIKKTIILENKMKKLNK